MCERPAYLNRGKRCQSDCGGRLEVGALPVNECVKMRLEKPMGRCKDGRRKKSARKVVRGAEASWEGAHAM